MEEGEKFPEFGAFLHGHKRSCNTVTGFRRDFWGVGLNGLQILAALLPSLGTERGQRPKLLAVPSQATAQPCFVPPQQTLPAPSFAQLSVSLAQPPGTNTPQAQPVGFGDPVLSLGQHREAQGPFLGVTSPQRDPGSAGLGETATEGASQGKTDLLPSNLSLLACGGALRQHPDTLCSLCSYSKV